MRVCENCGTPATSPWAKFCVKCGEPLPEPEPHEVPQPATAVAVQPGASYGSVPQYAYGFPQFPYAMLPQPKTSGAAVTSLVCGIMAFFVWFLGFVAAPVAIAAGVAGRRAVRNRPALVKGSGMATAGLVLGFVWMVLATAIVSLLVWDRVRGTL